MDRKKKIKHTYIQNPSNLFEDNCEEGNVDIAQSNNNVRPRFPPLQKKPTLNEGHDIEALERQRQDILRKKLEIEQRTLDSASRGLGLLHNSEKVGISAAEELICQREALNNTNSRLDEINPNLNQNQKHINSIKSIFYSIKKYISGKSDPEHSKRPSTRSLRIKGRPRSRLMDITMSRRSLTDCNYASHPSTLLRDSEQQVESKSAKSFEHRLADNLNEMGQVVGRLKKLGAALGEEIEDQNKLIDTISDKMEEADIKIDNQTKQMKNLLGK